MENHKITAAQISASSQADGNFAPRHGRLHYKGIGGAWAAGGIDANVHEWIQIDLRVEANVTFVATQGRYWNPDQRVTEYKLQYSKDGLSFQVYKQAGDNSYKVRIGVVFRKMLHPQFKNQIVTAYILFEKKKNRFCLETRPRLLLLLEIGHLRGSTKTLD